MPAASVTACCSAMRDVEVAVREALRELDQPRAFAHCRRDADDARVELGHVAQPLAEHLGIDGAGGLFLEDRAAGVERTRAVPLDRVGFRRRVALALARDDVQELRAFQVAQVGERLHQRVDVVAVDGPDVIEAQFLEQRAGQHHALHVLLGPAREFPHRGHAPQDLLAAFAQRGVRLAREHAREVIRQCADVLRDRHVVVVQDDEHVGVSGPA
jgi:hypothetical protein